MSYTCKDGYTYPINLIKKPYNLPCYDHCKSFYGKALILEDETEIMLLSYSTIVCCFRKSDMKFRRVWNDSSVTTLRHVSSFIYHFLGLVNGQEGISKKEWLSLDTSTSAFIDLHEIIRNN